MQGGPEYHPGATPGRNKKDRRLPGGGRGLTDSPGDYFPRGRRALDGAGKRAGSMRTRRRRQPRGLWGHGRAGPPASAALASLACSPNDPSPMAALQRMSLSLSLRASISAGTIWAASPFRCGRRRTAVMRSLRGATSDPRAVRRSISSCRSPRTPASKATEQHLFARAWPNSSVGRGRSPIAEHFATGYRTHVLISVGVNAAGEEMH